ncbi:MAG: dipeptidase [Thaumarchaeota archaeon]|nr:dipeptidase [Nitrososphaerota archaeon]
MPSPRAPKHGTIDMHADLPADVAKFRDLGERRVLERRHLSKLRKGGVTSLVAPVWVESEFKPDGAMKRALHVIDCFYQDLAESEHFQVVTTHGGLLRAESAGKIAVIIGSEGGEFLEDDVGLIRVFHRLGMRVCGFVWNERNLLADGWYHHRDDRGLSELGKKLVEEANGLHMLLDLTHIAPKSFYDVLEATDSPVMVSHGATSVHKSLRNTTDEQLRALAKNGGVFGPFAVNHAQTRTLSDYVDHVEHAVKVAGIEHVALGPDFYDYLIDDIRKNSGEEMKPLEGLEDHTKLGAVAAELRRRGMSAKDIELVSRGNFLRLMKTVIG